MKHLPCLFLFLFTFSLLSAQRIHAHNDYQQAEPLTHALRNQVFSLEADVYLVKGRLLVAHDKNELDTAPTLEALYLQPIIALYKKHQGRISADTGYAPTLLIDVKANGPAAIAALATLVAPYRQIFDRQVNPKAVQLVISGERGAVPQWTSYPAYILFDGRPRESYDAATLQRVAFISDSYSHYSQPADSAAYKLQQLAEQVHARHQLLRLWGMPDTPASWQQQDALGLDIINTDQVAACRDFFTK